MEQQTRTVSLPKPFCQAVPVFFDQELTEKIVGHLRELSTECQMPVNRQLQWHLREFILPGLAVYQVLRAEGQTADVALAIVDKLFDLVSVPYRRQMEWLGRFPLIYPLLRIYIRVAMHQYPAVGWQTEWAENSAQAIRFNMRSCFYFDTLSRYGVPELTASFCRNDDLVYEKMSPYLEWKRTQTIGRGAKYCNFCFARAQKR
jgi:hypothetical protein